MPPQTLPLLKEGGCQGHGRRNVLIGTKSLECKKGMEKKEVWDGFSDVVTQPGVLWPHANG